MFTNAVPKQIESLKWPWKNVEVSGASWAIQHGTEIRMPKNFSQAFDFQTFIIENIPLNNPTRWQFFGSRNHKSVFTTAARMIGYENLLVDKPDLTPIYEAYLEWNRRCIESIRAFHKGPISLFFGDDIAYNNGLMMSPEATLNYSLKWTLAMAARLKALATSDNPIKLLFHSCGDIADILQYLTDFDVLSYQPVGRMEIFAKNRIDRVGSMRLMVHNQNEAGINRPGLKE